MTHQSPVGDHSSDPSSQDHNNNSPLPRKRRLGSGAIVGIVAGALALVVVGVAGVFILFTVLQPQPRPGTGPVTEPGGKTVQYTAKAVGTTLTRVEYVDKSGKQATESPTGTVWSKSFAMDKIFVTLDVDSAADPGTANNTAVLTCAIAINGRTIDTKTGTSRVNCAGSIID